MKTTDRLDEDWILASEIHKLEARLWRKVRKDGIDVVMVTSAERGEGKSTTVAYLSSAMARHPDRRILAVDLDFREPQLNAHFQLDFQKSFGAVLKGKCPLEDAIVKTDLPNLDLILPAAKGEDPSLLFRTPAISEIFDTFRKTYDLVLMDVPALIPVADSSALLPFADAVVLMVMAGKTTKPMLNRAREICLGMDANILGIVVGNLDEALPEYGGARYYYGYSRGYQTGYARRRPESGGSGESEDQG